MPTDRHGMSDTAAALYRQLDAAELASVARGSILGLEDVQQEARLICWTVAIGESDFDPTRGSVRQYVMGRLWGLKKRYALGISLDGEEENDAGTVALRWLQAGSPNAGIVQGETLDRIDPLEQLIAAEEELAADGRRETRVNRLVSALPPAERTWARLVLSGAPSEGIADLIGMTRRGGRYRFDRLLQHVIDVAGNKEK